MSEIKTLDKELEELDDTEIEETDKKIKKLPSKPDTLKKDAVKKYTKARLIEEIKAEQSIKNYPNLPTQEMLSKFKKKELLEIYNKISDYEPKEDPVKQKMIKSISEQIKGYNIMLATFVEKIVKMVEDTSGYNIDGFAKSVAKNPMFDRVYEQVAEEHGETISTYTSPMTSYFIAMAVCAMTSLKEKKKTKKSKLKV